MSDTITQMNFSNIIYGYKSAWENKIQNTNLYDATNFCNKQKSYKQQLVQQP